MNEEKNLVYKLIKPIYCILLKIIFRPKVIGKENIPKDGAIIFAGNHKHAADPVMVMSHTKRIVHFMAKEELSRGIFSFLFKNVI